LNTHWYIKQLKDFEPKINIGLTDRQIEERLHPQRWETRTVKASTPDTLPPMKWKMKPTIQGRGIRVQDLMIWQIIQANNWERPIYFAVTVSTQNLIGLRKAGYLQMEGLAYKLHPKKMDDRLDVDQMRKNILEVYKYRNLDDPEVYFNNDAQKLVGNYRSSFFQLALRYMRQEDFERVVNILQEMEDRMPEEIFPFRTEQMSIQFSMMFHRALKGLSEQTGQPYDSLRKKYKGPKNVRDKVDDLISKGAASLDEQLNYAQNLLYGLEDYDGAIKILEKLQGNNPDNPKVLGLLVMAYQRSGQYNEAIAILEEWMKENPQDRTAQKMLKNLKSQRDQKITVDTTS
jgi:tetratricopeptide (TPR) repeat protein